MPSFSLSGIFCRRSTFWPVAGMVVMVFLAYFRRFAEFGFYGDDHAFFGGVINRSWNEAIDHFKWCLTKWPQGRPLGMGVNLSLLPYIVYSLGGVVGLHFAGFLIASTNGVLIYRLLKAYHPPLIAWSSAGFYLLAPVDTVQNSLVYAYNFELAVTTCLLAALAALRGRSILFILFLAMGLLMVEPVAMFALFAPLCLGVRLDRDWLWWSFRHVLRWTGTVLAVLICRQIIGDPWGSERVSEMTANPLLTLKSGLTTSTTGFHTHFDLIAERLIQPFREADGEVFTTMLAVGAISAFILWWLNSADSLRSSGGNSASIATPESSSKWTGIVALAAGGSVIMLAVYFAYFRAPWAPANWRTGFMSGVHVIAELGSCLIFASCVLLLTKLLSYRLRPLTFALPVFVFTAFAGFGTLVQRDYANSWFFQRSFWQAYGRQCADAGESTFVVVLDKNLPPVRYIDLFSWGAEILPGALYRYGAVSIAEAATLNQPITRPPTVILTAPELTTAIQQKESGYAWKPTYYFMLPKDSTQQPADKNVIVMTHEGQGRWSRIEGNATVDQGTLQLKSSSDPDILRHTPKAPLAAAYGL
ncbi:hypothetical protein [Nibricoccus aquaticus]|uniref:hypothetical protein n=1 Tax=Nibricoccus aquaticus TaxID=2576891 RepID=UPI0010FDB49A|nr:hypothetical protein [Nibricoccus aquaticus]